MTNECIMLVKYVKGVSKAFCQVDNIALQWFMQEQSRKRDCKKKTEIIIFLYIYILQRFHEFTTP